MTAQATHHRRLKSGIACICVCVVIYNVYSAGKADHGAVSAKDAETRRQQLTQSIRSLQSRKAESENARSLVLASLAHCAEAGPNIQMRYQNYLYNLADRSGLSDIVIRQGSPFTPAAQSQWLQCHTSAKGDADAVGHFLRELEKEEPGHRIHSAAFDIAGNASLSIAITTAICVTASPPGEHSLRVDDSNSVKHTTSHSLHALFGLKTQNTAKPPSKPAPVQTPPSLKKQEPISPHIVLIGTITRPGVRAALTFNKQSGVHYRHNEGASLPCGDGTNATVVAIGLDSILLTRQSATREMPIGATLQDAFGD